MGLQACRISQQVQEQAQAQPQPNGQGQGPDMEGLAKMAKVHGDMGLKSQKQQGDLALKARKQMVEEKLKDAKTAADIQRSSAQNVPETAGPVPTLSINYKDAPPDIRRQMEARDGFTPSRAVEESPNAPKPPPTPKTGNGQ